MPATPAQSSTPRRSYLTLVHSAPLPVHREPPGLTVEDIAFLLAWMERRHLHGYRAVEIAPGGPSGQPHDDRYAVVYEPDSRWAAWGIAREVHGVLVWECGSGKERGQYRTIQEAVRALPIIWHGRSRSRDKTFSPEPRCTVVRLA